MKSQSSFQVMEHKCWTCGILFFTNMMMERWGSASRTVTHHMQASTMCSSFLMVKTDTIGICDCISQKRRIFKNWPNLNIMHIGCIPTSKSSPQSFRVAICFSNMLLMHGADWSELVGLPEAQSEQALSFVVQWPWGCCHSCWWEYWCLWTWAVLCAAIILLWWSTSHAPVLTRFTCTCMVLLKDWSLCNGHLQSNMGWNHTGIASWTDCSQLSWLGHTCFPS